MSNDFVRYGNYAKYDSVVASDIIVKISSGQTLDTILKKIRITKGDWFFWLDSQDKLRADYDRALIAMYARLIDDVLTDTERIQQDDQASKEQVIKYKAIVDTKLKLMKIIGVERKLLQTTDDMRHVRTLSTDKVLGGHPNAKEADYKNVYKVADSAYAKKYTKKQKSSNFKEGDDDEWRKDATREVE